ncbi:MAG TPA: undecaprenyl-diphosphatase UppP [Candidatus Paceibacterota bacterium]
MTDLQALILGVVEGITEFLPISSTAHLMFASSLLGLAQSDFVKSFEIAIQLGAILAVVVLYWRTILDWRLMSKIVTAFIPTAIIGLVLYHFIKTYLLGNTLAALWVLGIGGIVLIAFEWWHGKQATRDHETISEISYTQAALIGVAQSVAVVPGVSRSAATIGGGLLMGINRETIVQFSFLLAVPTMAAATGLDLLKSYKDFTSADVTVLAIGFVASFVVALIAIKWFMGFVRKHTFTGFGLYRIAAALVLFFLIFK